MSKHYQVEQIIEYLKAKIESTKKELDKYESPIMVDITKNSPHLQFEYIRLKAILQENEAILLTIDKFTDIPVNPKGGKNEKQNRQSREK
jgi:hypothetical protein